MMEQNTPISSAKHGVADGSHEAHTNVEHVDSAPAIEPALSATPVTQHSRSRGLMRLLAPSTIPTTPVVFASMFAGFGFVPILLIGILVIDKERRNAHPTGGGASWVLVLLFLILSHIAMYRVCSSPCMCVWDPKKCRWCSHALVGSSGVPSAVCTECGKDQTVTPALPWSAACWFFIFQWLLLAAMVPTLARTNF